MPTIPCYVLRDRTTGLYFNRPQLQSPGCWWPITAFAPTFETRADAQRAATALGPTIDAVPLTRVSQ